MPEQSTKQAIAEREITSPHEQARLVSGAAGAGDRHMIKLPDINDGKESSEMDIWDLKNTRRMARRCAKRASSYAPAIIETCGGRPLLQGAHYGRKTAGRTSSRPSFRTGSWQSPGALYRKVLEKSQDRRP
jgi:hypothetical protein